MNERRSEKKKREVPFDQQVVDLVGPPSSSSQGLTFTNQMANKMRD